MLNLNCSKRHKNSGFTLIEILISISIFAILSLAAYQILQGVLRSGEISRVHDLRLTEIQRSMLLIERDFVQMVARSSRSSGIDSEKLQVIYSGANVLDSESQGIEFNRLGWTNPLNLLPRSNVLRVGYRIQEEKLQRVYYLYPDLDSGQKPEVQVLLNDVESLSFRFWDEGWSDSWSNKTEIPRGIEMTIVSKYYGELRRVFLLANSTVEN